MISHPISEDWRYEIEREFCGRGRPRFVLRFAGEFIASDTSYATLTDKAREHKAARMETL